MLKKSLFSESLNTILWSSAEDVKNLIHKNESGLKVFRAVVPEQGILIDPYKFSDVDLPFNYSIELEESLTSLGSIAG